MPGTPRRANAKGIKAPKLDFPVTQDHIDTAVPRDSSHCMIADALKEAYPDAEYVSVDLATIRFTDRLAGWRYIYLTPRRAQLALIKFDQGEKPEPFNVKDLRCAQIVPTSGARRKAPKDPDTGRKTRTPAVLVDQGGEGKVPAKVGGHTLPLAPSAAGSGSNKVGRSHRREFGLHGFIE